MSSVALRAEDYQQVGQESSEGYSVELSSYDIPREISIEADAGHVVRIYFKYAAVEEAAEQNKELTEHIRMSVGKHSGKILCIEIDSAGFDSKQTAVAIRRHLNDMIPSLAKFNQRANYKVISSVLDRNMEAVFQQVEPYLRSNIQA